jgi:3-oxoacyl-[acyl-carrier protein] reductase
VKERVVLITGAARGLGRAAAERFLQEGARVVVNTRDAARTERLAASLGPGAAAVTGDVSRRDEVESMVGKVVERFGRLDVLINNAAVAYSTRFENIREEEWRRTLDVNLTGAFFCIRAAVPAMKQNGYGRVINVSSTAGKTVSTLAGAHYTASKHGLLGLTRAAAKELGPLGITVNAICPGLIDTELAHENSTPAQLETLVSRFPVARLGQPIEVAELLLFLASEGAGFITGAAFDINGGSLMI